MHHFARKLGPTETIFVSAIEHPCVDDSSRHYFGKRVKTIPVTREGVVDLDWLTGELADARPGLVAVMAANNETGDHPAVAGNPGHLPGLRGAVLHRCGAVHRQAALQGAGRLRLCERRGAQIRRTARRGLSENSASHARLTPLLLGGKQEGGRRAGTENVAIIAAMMAAMDVREKQIARSEHLLRKVWRDNFEAQLLRALPGATVLGHNQPRLWNTVSALMPEGDRKSQWVSGWTRRALPFRPVQPAPRARKSPPMCSRPWAYKSAHALRAVRFSAGWETTELDWDALLKAVVKVHGEMQPKT